MIMVSGDSGAVKQAVMAGEIGLQLLSTMGDNTQILADTVYSVINERM